jgi:hypothetical protein
MTFIDSGVQKHSINHIHSNTLSNFSIQEERLVFTCECGEVIDCIKTLHSTLFVLNALCDSRFHSFTYAIESKLVSMWIDNFTHIIPIVSKFTPPNNVISIGELAYLISQNFETPFHTPTLFQKLNLTLNEGGEGYPIILFNGLLRIPYGCKFPLLQYYENGMSGLSLRCENCFKFASYNIEGDLQYFKDL